MIGVPFSRSCGERRDARNFDSMIQDNLHMRWRFCGRTTPAGWSCTTTSIGYRRPISNFADGDGCSFSSRPSFLVFFFLFSFVTGVHKDGAQLGYPFHPRHPRPPYSQYLRYENAQHDPATNGTTDVLLGSDASAVESAT